VEAGKVTEIIPIDPIVRDRWLSNWMAHDPFSKEAIRNLQMELSAKHYLAVVTLTRTGQPFSLVFRSQKTVSLVGKRFKAVFKSPGDRTAISARFQNQPIDLDPLSDQLIISAQGNSLCSFREAMAIAEEKIRWWPCPVIYTFDGTNIGRA
jgi:hypothetical protein